MVVRLLRQFATRCSAVVELMIDDDHGKPHYPRAGLLTRLVADKVSWTQEAFIDHLLFE